MITKGTRISVKGEGTKLVDGYEISYDGSSVITHYSVVTSGDALPGIESEYTRVAAAGPASLRRPPEPVAVAAPAIGEGIDAIHE